MNTTAAEPGISPYRASGTRALLLVGLLIVTLIFYVGALGWEIIGIGLTDFMFRSTVEYTDLEALLFSTWLGAGVFVGIGQLATYFATAVAFFAWQSRIVDNIPALVGAKPVQSPRWSIGWWFVPFANLYKPFESVRDVGRLLAPTRGMRDRLVTLWWGLFLGSAFAGRIYGYLPLDTADQWLVSGLAGLVSWSLGIAAAFVAVRMVLALQADAEARAAEAAARNWVVSPVDAAPNVTDPG